jgi:hypothetical protein
MLENINTCGKMQEFIHSAVVKDGSTSNSSAVYVFSVQKCIYFR